MHSIDVALRRNASDAFVVPGVGGVAEAAHRSSALIAHARSVLARRLPLLLTVMLMVQLLAGALSDPARALTPVMSTAVTLAGAVSGGVASAGAAMKAVTVAGAATSAATLRSIAAASHVDAASQAAAFATLDSARVTPAVVTNPSTVDHILDAALPALDVAAWWTSLSAGERAALADASPTLVGNLDGVPLDERIAANRASAARLLASSSPFGADRTNQQTSYLARVVSGAVSLYAFDIGSDSIVEMIGDAVAATRTLVFTPGTSASLSDFYGGSIQDLARWEVEHATASAPTVAFVYKTGSFPQWTMSDGPFDNNRSITLGVLFDRFNEGLDTTVVGSLARTSVEHSFGSSIGGVAETLGTRFDTRVVLGGVGMLAGWEPSATTRYVAYVAGNDVTRYIYGLVEGDDMGYAIAPSAAHGFEQKDPALSSADWYLPARLFAGIIGPAIEVAQGFVNHNTVASADDNHAVLRGLLADITDAGAEEDSGTPGSPDEAPASPHVDLVFLPTRESRIDR
jgi:hypothetical protein